MYIMRAKGNIFLKKFGLGKNSGSNSCDDDVEGNCDSSIQRFLSRDSDGGAGSGFGVSIGSASSTHGPSPSAASQQHNQQRIPLFSPRIGLRSPRQKDVSEAAGCKPATFPSTVIVSPTSVGDAKSVRGPVASLWKSPRSSGTPKSPSGVGTGFISPKEGAIVRESKREESRHSGSRSAPSSSDKPAGLDNSMDSATEARSLFKSRPRGATASKQQSSMVSGTRSPMRDAALARIRQSNRELSLASVREDSAHRLSLEGSLTDSVSQVRINGFAESDNDNQSPAQNGTDTPQKQQQQSVSPRTSGVLRIGRKGKGTKRPVMLSDVGVGTSDILQVGKASEAMFAGSKFTSNDFVISKQGMENTPASLVHLRSKGNSLEDIAPSPHNHVQIDSLHDLEILRVLGQGAGGKVLLGQHVPSGRKLAIKVINVYDEKKREQLIKELQTLMMFTSRFLVRFHNAFYDGKGQVHVALEYMDCGALSDFIKKRGPIPEQWTNYIAYHCLYGLKFLHDSKHLHRDFKTANVLLSAEMKRAKLSDFGLSRAMNGVLSKAQTFVGTMGYMSPERLSGSPYTYASDIWGLGVSLAECLLGKYPWQNVKPQVYFDYIEAADTEPLLPPGVYSEPCEDFIFRCCHPDPAVRPRVDALLAHPWIANVKRDHAAFGAFLRGDASSIS
ncbi:Mitogen-activated protein kinase kinase 3 [Porphyridium purpureum]|uniref:mitogen-activated protein kinase kinase n=1 Tax=Porphyridium purpureum TaxID=35688 RepID=A0A5J4Z507_PORPP|nr:Mitogen-activated protein kinase kinase 3 [Porphyridium purpureum]|eukprot:POR6115..scf295_1